MVIKERTKAAEALGITARSLGDWRKLPGFPDCSAGYDIPAITKWRHENQKKGSKEDNQLVLLNKALKMAKLEEIKKKNHLQQLEIERVEGQLLPRRAYELFISTLLSGIGDWCEQLPSLIEGELPAKHARKVRQRLEQELRRMRDQLADDLKQSPLE